MERAALLIDAAVQEGFESNRTRPMELGGDQGNREVTDNLLAIIEDIDIPDASTAA